MALGLGDGPGDRSPGLGDPPVAEPQVPHVPIPGRSRLSPRPERLAQLGHVLGVGCCPPGWVTRGWR